MKALKPFRLLSLLSILLIMLSFFSPEAKSISSLKGQSFSNFDILHADNLEFKDENTILIGDVRIKFEEYDIKAPKVEIITDSTGSSPETIKFFGGVTFKTKEMNIESERVEIDFKADLIKCYGEPDVVSEWGSGKKATKVISNYQEYNFNTGIASAKTNDPEKKIITESKVRTIEALAVQMKYNSSKKNNKNRGVEFINFEGEVILVEDDKRVEAGDLYYWLPGEMLKANDDVKILLYSKKFEKGVEPIYLFADQMVLEEETNVMSASMRDLDKFAQVYAKDLTGKGRQIRVDKARKNPDQLVFTGNAYAQYKDKAIEGEEVLFDLKKKSLASLVGRPHTKILSSKK